MKQKLLLFLVTAVLSTGLLAACGNNDETQEAQTESSAAEES